MGIAINRIAAILGDILVCHPTTARRRTGTYVATTAGSTVCLALPTPIRSGWLVDMIATGYHIY